MSQVVDLGYVVGPTGPKGPKGDDATLPQTEKVTVYVAGFIHKGAITYEHKITYVADRQVNTVTIPGTLDESEYVYNLEDFTPIEVDYGSVALVRTYRNGLDGYEETGNMLGYFDPSDMTSSIQDKDYQKSPRVYLDKAEAFVCVCPVAVVIDTPI